MSEKVSIIISYNGEREYLNLLLTSINICSINNEYEIIIINNKHLLNINNSDKIKIYNSPNEISYKESILKGLELISDDSGYIIFIHPDNVILNKKWLDFLIETEMDNDECGGLAIGSPMKFIGPSGKENFGPYYNFLFVNKELFNNLGGFKYLTCENVGIVLGYQHQLQEIEKKIILVNSQGFIHHYGLGKITEKEKITDVEEFNKKFIQRINKY